MRVKLPDPQEGYSLILCDWSEFEHYWQLNSVQPIDRGELHDAYLSLWFEHDAEPPLFTPGFASLWPDGYLGFTSGRHRTNLLVKHRADWIPLEIDYDSLTRLGLQRSRVVRAGQLVDLPDLPIRDPVEMRSGASRCLCCAIARQSWD